MNGTAPYIGKFSSPKVDRVLEERAASEMPEGLVTVCVSLFNYARFLPDCLNSILKQRYAPIELVVVDDASNRDDSLQVARDWLQQHHQRFHRVLLLSHVRNQGLAQARNTGFAHSEGEHVFVIDADNEIYPRAIERMHEVLIKNRCAAAYTQLEMFGDQRRLGYADVWSQERFRSGNYVDAMALVSKEAWQAVGGYSHLEGGWEDFDFWCKFIDHGLEAIYIPEVLCRYRVHGTSMLRTETKEMYKQLSIEMCLRHPWLNLAFD